MGSANLRKNCQRLSWGEASGDCCKERRQGVFNEMTFATFFVLCVLVQGHENDVLGWIVQEAVKVQGLRDDTTCLVVDIVPPGRASRSFAPAVRKQMLVMKFLRRTRSKNSINTGVPMEELFDENSATLAERYSIDFGKHTSQDYGLHFS